MGMQCEVCGKKPIAGNQKTYRGKAKYLGGVGRKITGTSRRIYYPNLQCIRVAGPEGQTVRKHVCVQCIRSGRIQKPVRAQDLRRRRRLTPAPGGNLMDLNQVRKVARLARLEMTDEELGVMARQLTAILAYVDQLKGWTPPASSRWPTRCRCTTSSGPTSRPRP